MRVLGIIGPSGCGKTTILEQLHKKSLVHINPTYTERPKRTEDEEELEHKFVTPAEFDRLEESGFFIKVIRAFGLKYRYAVPKLQEEKGKVALVMLRAQLVPLLLKLYPASKVYQIEAPFSVAAKWMKKRGDNETGTRLDGFEAELKQGREYADRVFINNGDLSACVRHINEAIKEDFK